MSKHLTSDNPYLSRPTLPDCSRELAELVATYVQDSLADNTRRAYLSDLAHFEYWGGSLPSSDKMLASYFASHAETLSAATLVRRLTSISKAHEARGYTNPARSSLVRATLRGIKRRQGTAQHQAKPLLKEDLISILDAMGDTPRDVRDRALLLIGFAGGFRRSELVAIDIGAIGFARQGAIITVPKSKTDQLGAGRKVGIPLGRTRYCPVSALEVWIARAGLNEGPVFRPLSRHGRVIEARLSGEAVSLIIKERVAAAGINPADFSGHSLRAGFVTSAAQAGVPTWRIRQQTGHTSDSMLQRYIREAELFVQNDAGALL